MVTEFLWPIIVGGALWYFRKEIRTLLASRTFKLGTQGIEVGALPPQQSPTEAQKGEHGLAPTTVTASGDARAAGDARGSALQTASSTLPAFRDFMTEFEQRI